jgi:hypothetical protein
VGDVLDQPLRGGRRSCRIRMRLGSVAPAGAWNALATGARATVCRRSAALTPPPDLRRARSGGSQGGAAA